MACIVLWIRIGFSADLESDPMRIQIWIRIQEAERMWSRWVRILVKSQKLKFYMKNIFQVGTDRTEIVQKTYIRWYKSLFEWQKTRFICKFCPISMVLDPDSQDGSGSKTAKSMRIQVDPDPQHWFCRSFHPIRVEYFLFLRKPYLIDWFSFYTSIGCAGQYGDGVRKASQQVQPRL